MERPVTHRVNPFHGRHLRWLLSLRAEEQRDESFLIWVDLDGGERTWTYGQLLDDVRALAAGLEARGITKGTPVCVHMDNCPEFVVAWLALAWMGAIAVPTNTRSVAEELSYFLAKSGSRAALTQAHHLAVVAEAVDDQWVGVVGAHDSTAALATVPFEALFEREAKPSAPRLDPMDAAAVLFTSGTTSRPKGVVWTHANYLWGGKVSAGHEGLRRDDRHLVFLPLFHANAQMYSMMATLWAGGSAILLPRFSASRFWDIAVRHGATVASMIPFATRALRNHPVPETHAFRLWLSAVGDPPYARYFRVPVLGIWGMTETVTHCVVGELGVPLARPLSMGVPAPEYDVRVVTPSGEQVRPGSTGELQVRGWPGVSLFLGYHADPEATAASWTDDGWLRTGDIVRFDPEGTLTFSDREKDMLKVGGENVAASEIERVISEVPGVVEAAVVAIPDDMLNEVPYAFVIGDTDDDALPARVLDHCAKTLADFKRPRHVDVVDELPRATLNKVAKKDLRERATSRLRQRETVA